MSSFFSSSPMLIRSATFTALALSLVSCATPAPTSSAGQGYSFGLWGDMPYKKAGDDPKLLAVLKSVNDADVAFSLYDGDTKDGNQAHRLPPHQQWRPQQPGAFGVFVQGFIPLPVQPDQKFPANQAQ